MMEVKGILINKERIDYAERICEHSGSEALADFMKEMFPNCDYAEYKPKTTCQVVVHMKNGRKVTIEATDEKELDYIWGLFKK